MSLSPGQPGMVRSDQDTVHDTITVTSALLPAAAVNPAVSTDTAMFWQVTPALAKDDWAAAAAARSACTADTCWDAARAAAPAAWSIFPDPSSNRPTATITMNNARISGAMITNSSDSPPIPAARPRRWRRSSRVFTVVITATAPRPGRTAWHGVQAVLPGRG